MESHKIILYVCAIILVSLSVISEGGKRPRGKKYPVKPLFGVGLGYRKVVSYKPVLVFQKHKHYKIRHHHGGGGWGWGGWHGHHGGHGHGGYGHGGGHGHHGHGKGHGGKGHHGGGHGGWASSYQDHHDGWSRGGGGHGWGWDDEVGYDDPHEHYGGWESSLSSLNWTAESHPSHNHKSEDHDEVNHSPISTRPEMHNNNNNNDNDNLSNHNLHNHDQNQGKPFNEMHLNENQNHNHRNREVENSRMRNTNNMRNQAPNQGQHHPLIQNNEEGIRFPDEVNDGIRHEGMMSFVPSTNFHRQNPDDPFHNFHNSDFLRRRRHQNYKGRRRNSIQDVLLAGGSDNFDVVYVNENKKATKDSSKEVQDKIEDDEITTGKREDFDVKPPKMEFITTPSSFFSTTAFPSFREFRRKQITSRSKV